ncbi:hypothetical protein B9Z55_027252 [Caenorhabditis nigoni]|uniref:Uncharacterized protein n=2 Tax=Caenorhabditis nigoni TaxID=1611254 RepID=A0A2G5SH88_9PELO|nr:hypothetical protein B9Z55_027252 [Caenorhabditis nigoni]
MMTTNEKGAKLLLLLLLVPLISAQAPTDSTTVTQETPTEPTTVTEPTTTTPSPPPPPPKLKQYNFEGPLTDIHGSYSLRVTTHDKGRPGIASVWPVSSAERQFAVYFWPPKYCHAIHLCAVNQKTYDGKNVFDEFDCDSSYVKFYPHIRKILFKPDAATTETDAFYVEPALQFQRRDGDEKFQIRVLNEEPRNQESWKAILADPSKYQDLIWDLTGKELLILTNSRMCEVNKPGIGDFLPIFDHENSQPVADQKWPKWLPNDAQNKAIPTYSMASTGGSTKTTDLLDYLKTLKVQANKLQNVDQHCSNYEKVGVFGARKPVYEHSPYISTASYDLFQPSMVVTSGYVQKLEFELSNCQWIRFWATEDSVTMADYATQMKPEHTLDIFIQEGFYLSPDSDEALPLPDAQLMNKIKLSIFSDGDPTKLDDHELIEFAFGNVNDKYLFHQFFKSKEFGKKNFRLHMIRSPRCESNIVLDDVYRDNGHQKLPNIKGVRDCSYSYLV